MKSIKRVQDSPAKIQKTPKQQKLSIKVKSNKKRNSLWNLELERDESLFGLILTQDLELEDEEEDCLNTNILCDDLSDTTICEDENHQNEYEKKLDDIEFNETFEIHCDFVEEKSKDAFQNTEKFFADIKEDLNQSDFIDFQNSQMGGTFYETRDDIKNTQEFKVPATPKVLSQISWETQVFEEESKSKGLFVSKGPFYGLPVKVEQLIYSSKGIKALYGNILRFFPCTNTNPSFQIGNKSV